MVSGCGAGAGGGAGGYRRVVDGNQVKNQEDRSLSGKGGEASAWTTVILGPLSADTYTLTIPKGGAGGQTTPQGVRGSVKAAAAGGVSEFSGADIVQRFPGGAASSRVEGPTDANPPATAGLNSVFGKETGEAAGASDKNGSDASGACAGGGGAGNPLSARGDRMGGNGGPGMIVVYPLPDMKRLFEVLVKVNPPIPAPIDNKNP
jgi:hypothetical protein